MSAEAEELTLGGQRIAADDRSPKSSGRRAASKGSIDPHGLEGSEPAGGRGRGQLEGAALMVGTRDHFVRKPEELVSMLETIQKSLGYLPEDALLGLARLTKLPPATVYGVATFYEQFRLTPGGRHMVKLCRGTACHVRGAARILNDVEKAFEVKPGDTTEDGSFTLETVACFGSCALAPVVVVDDTVKGRMTASKTRAALQELRDASEPSPALAEIQDDGEPSPALGELQETGEPSTEADPRSVA